VHGAPFDDIDESSASDLFGKVRRWAFDVLRDFVEYTTGHAGMSLAQVLREVDGSELVPSVVDWLVKAGGERIVKAHASATNRGRAS
jgi:hypothetical protein